MKKLVFSLVLLSTMLLTKAQSTLYKPFKVDISVGDAIPSGSGSKGGVLFAFEPKYAINDNITLGLRLEGAVTARGFVDQYGDMVQGEAHASASYLITGDYYFTTSYVRPFAGIGVGIYNWAGATADENGNTVVTAAQTSFGIAPRVGVEIGHFRLGIEYNVAGKTGIINNNYLGIKAGFCIGGGRIR